MRCELYWMSFPLFSIGHSNHSQAHFLLMLREHKITALVDVRSVPYSRRCPHFHRKQLAEVLPASTGIAYVYLGHELGVRRDEPECYDEQGRVVFARIAETAAFQQGLERLRHGLETHRIAMMCAEHDPLECHRGILIAPRMLSNVSELLHIRRDGTLESHAAAEDRLMRKYHLPDQGLFHTHEQLLAAAYLKQEERIAYRRPQKGSTGNA